jgi:hypothetical protein
MARDAAVGISGAQDLPHFHKTQRPCRGDEAAAGQSRIFNRLQVHLRHVAHIDYRQADGRLHRVLGGQEAADQADRTACLGPDRGAKHETGVDRGQRQIVGGSKLPGRAFGEGLGQRIRRGGGRGSVAPIGLGMLGPSAVLQDRDARRGQYHPANPCRMGGPQGAQRAVDSGADQLIRVLGLRDGERRGGMHQHVRPCRRLYPTVISGQVGLVQRQAVQRGRIGQMRAQIGAQGIALGRIAQGGAQAMARVQHLHGAMAGDEAGDAGQ